MSDGTHIPSEECDSGIHAHACSALIDGRCINGFPVSRGCVPFHSVSPSGKDHWYAATPICCDEEYERNE